MKIFLPLLALLLASVGGIDHAFANGSDPDQNILTNGESLMSNESMLSGNGLSMVVMRASGELEVELIGRSIEWSSGTAGSGASRAIVLPDGTFRLENSLGNPVLTFYEGSPSSAGAQLRVENDNRLVLYGVGTDGAPHVLWESAADELPPTLAIGEESQDPISRNAGIITFKFSEVVNGLQMSSGVSLTRDGVNVDVTGLVATTTDMRTYCVDFSGVTSTPGGYTLRVDRETSGVTDLSGSPLSFDAIGFFEIIPAFTYNATISGAIRGVQDGALSWIDHDADGDLDLLLVGTFEFDGADLPTTEIYDNTGSGLIRNAGASDSMGTIRVSLGEDALAWGDYDRDGDPDLLVDGETFYDHTDSGFVRNAALEAGLGGGVDFGAWGDYDNDGDLDLLTGGGSWGTCNVFENTGSGFVRDASISDLLAGVDENGTLDWVDYDQDGDLDIFTTGRLRSDLYENTGTGFVRNEGVSEAIPGVSESAIAWGDYDNDGDLDLLMTGLDTTDPFGSRVAALYENQGSAGFVLDSGASSILVDVSDGAVAWGDYDNDGDPDILLSGIDEFSNAASHVYVNTGTGFVRDAQTSGLLRNLYDSSAVWGDFGNDGDLDILLGGYDGNEHTEFYESSGFLPNSPPAAPEGLIAGNLTASSADLSWSAPSDDTTPPGSLSYQLRIGTTPGGRDVSSPNSDLATGRSYVAARGLVNTTSWTIKGLSPGTRYYWSVQAIDHGLAAGAFAAEGSFEIPTFDSLFHVASDLSEGAQASLVAHYDGWKGVSTSGNNTVTSWQPVSGAGLPITAAGYTLGSVQRGMGAADLISYVDDDTVAFDVSDLENGRYLEGQLTGNAASSDYTVFWLGKFAPAATNPWETSGSYSFNLGSNDIGHQMDSGNAEIYNGTTYTGDPIGGWEGTHAVWSTVVTAGSHKAYVDGIDLNLPGAPSYQIDSDPSLVVGAFGAGGYHFKGEIKHMLVFRSALSDADRALVRSYLTTRDDPYFFWINDFYKGVTDPAIIGKNADPNGDGVVNGFAFIYASSPKFYDSRDLPTFTRDASAITVAFRRDDGAEGLMPGVEYGNDLIGWTRAEHSQNGVTITVGDDFYAQGVDQILVRIPHEGNPRLFTRMVATFSN